MVGLWVEATGFWGGVFFIVVPLKVLHIWLERAAKGLRGKGQMGRKGLLTAF